MVDFTKFKLQNGLRVLIHTDMSTPMIAVNVLYNVGARDESPEKTGLAHLFEHLMFGGSVHIPDFDEPIQNAGGDNNAFTNNDITNYYDVVPKENLEIALWLESDRMLKLDINEEALDVQRKVVLEEFKETCLNQPYGDVWHHINDMAYKVHPYRWPTIGKVPKHLEDTTLEDVQSFYDKYYHPNNAILTLAGNITEAEARPLVEKWFGDIPSGNRPSRTLPQEPPQKKLEQRINQSNVPVDAIYLAFHSPGRAAIDFYTSDLLSDILSNGPSCRLYQRLQREQKIVTSVDAYITGSIDPGLFVVEAKPTEGYTLEQVEQAIWQELNELKNELIPERELQKIKNKVESTITFSEMSVINKAINLAYFELLEEPDLINREAEIYQNITAEQLRQMAQSIFTKENCCKLHYKAND
ncbi:MAG: pitrilysin family protein [Bacteroidota bacterium]